MPNRDEMQDEDLLVKVQNYRDLVLTYERLNAEISQLLTENDGATENMSREDVQRYRELARQRDEALNEMRVLERLLLDEDTKH
jgi:hypothetical protein